MDLKCPYHPEAHLIEDHRAGDMICPNCGLVVGDRIVDVGTEWRSFNNEKSCKDPSRVGAPENPLLSGSDLSTSIQIGTGWSSTSIFALYTCFGSCRLTVLRESERLQYNGNNELANAQRKQGSNSDRQLIQAMSIIREMASRIHLPNSIQDMANKVYKDTLDSRALRGKNSEAVAAACLYIACRKEGVPRTFKEICAVSRTSKKEIGKCFKTIVKALETNLEHITSDQFMSRFCGNLGISQRVQAGATQIAKQAVKLDLVAGRSPISIAAAAIYMASQASNDKKTAKEIGEIAGVAEVTIKQSYKLLYPSAEKLLPESYPYRHLIYQLPMP